jgi:hypothetical protein
MLETKQHQIAEAERLPIPTVQTIVDGKLCDAASGKTLAVVSPINGETIATARSRARAKRSYRDPGRV